MATAVGYLSALISDQIYVKFDRFQIGRITGNEIKCFNETMSQIDCSSMTKIIERCRATANENYKTCSFALVLRVSFICLVAGGEFLTKLFRSEDGISLSDNNTS